MGYTEAKRWSYILGGCGKNEEISWKMIDKVLRKYRKLNIKQIVAKLADGDMPEAWLKNETK